MRVLITGCKGYIGSVLTTILLKKGYHVVGLDCGFYEENVTGALIEEYSYIRKDIRDVDSDDFAGVDAVIHLAGLSNDPLGEFDSRLTEDINYNGSVHLISTAKKNKVNRFVFASTQSIYGVSEADAELDEDASEKSPVTAYAKTKWRVEEFLREQSQPSFVTSIFRPSTVFGWSPRLRSDIVFNNFLSCAYHTGKIEILSDGTPWRPVVHVHDVCQAFIAGIEASSEKVNGKAFNVGVNGGNYTVKELALAAQRLVPGSELDFVGGHSDPRTYRVSFAKIYSELGDFYQPAWDLVSGGKQMLKFFEAEKYRLDQFRGRQTIRLEQLRHLKDNLLVDADLRFSG